MKSRQGDQKKPKIKIYVLQIQAPFSLPFLFPSILFMAWYFSRKTIFHRIDFIYIKLQTQKWRFKKA